MKGCWLFHRWNRWGEPIVGTVRYIWSTEFPTVLQVRTCERCGRMQVRRLGD